MSELREVFEMVRNRIEFVPDAWEEQQRRQRRMARNRRIGAISVSATLAIVAAAWFVLSGSGAIDGSRETIDGSRGTNNTAEQPATLPAEPGVYLFDLESSRPTRVAGIAPPGYESPGIAVSPDGTKVAYRGTDPEGDHVIYVASVDGTNIRPLEKTAATASNPVAPQFSPDGSQIAYQALDRGGWVGDIFLVDIATGETTRLTHLEPVYSSLWFMGPTFSPNGRTVFFTLPANSLNESWALWSVPASGGEPRLVLPDAIGGRLSPDGGTIVYFKKKPSAVNPFFGDLWVADVDGTDARRLASGDVFSARWSPDGTRIAYTEQGRGAYVVDVTTGEISRVLADTDKFPEWVDDHTWIVGVD